MFTVNQRVKRSEYYLQPARDRWLSLGRYPEKQYAKDEYERRRSERGTVTKILTDKNGKPNGIEVKTDEGFVHRSLCYLWEEE